MAESKLQKPFESEINKNRYKIAFITISDKTFTNGSMTCSITLPSDETIGIYGCIVITTRAKAYLIKDVNSSGSVGNHSLTFNGLFLDSSTGKVSDLNGSISGTICTVAVFYL